MILQYVTITTRDAITLALGMGIFADLLAVIAFLMILVFIKEYGNEANEENVFIQRREFLCSSCAFLCWVLLRFLFLRRPWAFQLRQE